ncbi:MAG: hypothetical protein AAFV33_06090 [Chloroflexota bacterium]
MKQTIQLVLICLAILTACQPAPTVPAEPVTTDTQPEALPAAVPTIASATLNHQNITVQVPPGWDALATERAILYTESHHSFETVGHLDGISVSVFSPSSTDLAAYESTVFAAHNPAHMLLTLVVNGRHYPDNAQVTSPQTFQWQGFDAAYYTLSNEAGIVTVLVAVSLPEETLLVFNISAPNTERQRLRQQLPDILGQITVGEYTLYGDQLTDLPALLRYPADDRNVSGN